VCFPEKKVGTSDVEWAKDHGINKETQVLVSALPLLILGHLTFLMCIRKHWGLGLGSINRIMVCQQLMLMGICQKRFVLK
jgi:hypothetical protein